MADRTVFGQRAQALLGASAFAMSIAALPGSALAQTAPVPAAAETGLDTIVVTARKVNENLQDVPVAVTVLSGSDLQARNIERIENIAAFTPGLSIRQAQSSPSAINITLRGQVQGDILATLDPSVGTYVDGVYWARAYGLNGGFLDISSVQALKGPQGTLFGRNTTGGALLINSNDPELGRFTGNASVGYGRFKEFEATGVLNIPVGDKIAIRLAGKRTSRDGYTTNSVPAGTATAIVAGSAVQRTPFVGTPNGVVFDNRDRWQFRGKLLLQPTETLSLIFSGEYFDMNETTPSREIVLATNTYTAANSTYSTASTAALFAGILSGGPPPTSGANAAASTALGLAALNAQTAFFAANPNLTSNNEVPFTHAQTHTYNFTGALDTDWGQIKLVAGIRDVNTYSSLDLEGSSFPIHITEGNQRFKQESAELQFTGKAFNNAVDFAAGGFVFHEGGFDSSISVTVPALNGTTSHFYGIINNDSIGVYGQATWHITDRLGFTGGLRYSVDDKGLESRANNYVRATGVTICSIQGGNLGNLGGEIVGPAGCAINRRDSFAGVSYTAGLDYRLTDDILIYAKTAKGFRSGGQNLRAPSAAAFLPYAPEIAYSYEIGFKSEFFDRRLRLNMAAYTTDVNNIQRTTLISVPAIPPSTVAGTATILSNAGKARFQGVEAELTALIVPGLTVTASGALVDPKYVNFADLSGDRSFERFVGVAKRQFALGADYKGNLSDSVKVALHVDYTWRSDIATSEYNFVANPQNAAIIAATTAPALGEVGARAAITFADNYEIAVYGRNLTNDRSYVQNLLVAPLGYITGIRNQPATYGVTASVKF
jgi:iron complex outermembrane recepter protein